MIGLSGLRKSRLIATAVEFFRHTSSAFMIHGLGLGLTFLAQILLARALGPTDYGIYAFVLSCLMILAGVSTLGLDRASVRFVAGYVELAAWSKLKTFSDLTTHLVGAVAIIIASLAIVTVLVMALFVPLGPDIPLPALLFGAAAIPLLTFVRLESGRMRGYGAVVRALFPDYVVRDGIVVIGTIFLLLGATKSGGPVYAMALTFAGCLFGFLLAVRFRKTLEPKALDKPLTADTTDRRLWMTTALGLGAVTVAQVSMQRIDVILLTSLGRPEDAGLFNAAFSLANLALFPMLAANIYFAPQISRLFVAGKTQELQRLVSLGTAGTFLIALLMALPLLLAPALFLGLFGTEFTVADNGLRMMLAAQLAAMAVGLSPVLLAMTGGEKELLLLTSLVLLGKLVAGLLLYAAHGLTAAVLTVTVANLSLYGLLAIAAWRRTNIRPIFFPKSYASDGKES